MDGLICRFCGKILAPDPVGREDRIIRLIIGSIAVISGIVLYFSGAVIVAVPLIVIALFITAKKRQSIKCRRCKVFAERP